MDFYKTELFNIHTGWARWTISSLRLKYPGIEAKLYKTPDRFHIVIENLPLSLTDEVFNSEIRPATCDIALSTNVPANSSIIEDYEYGQELWLTGQPVSVPTLNQLLMLASKDVPHGGIDFDTPNDEWVFTSNNALDENNEKSVISAMAKIGQNGPVRFENKNTAASVKNTTLDKVNLLPSQLLKQGGCNNVYLVESDEDNWRSFISRRSERDISTPSFTNKFECLFDTVDQSDISLSELLCIHDVVNIMPEIESDNWLSRHQLTLDDLQSLVSLGRLRLVLPYSLKYYPEKIISAAAEANPEAIILSRTLTSKCMAQGQKKDPLLYCPLTAREQSLILSVVQQSSEHDYFKSLIKNYSKLLERQQHNFITQGAAGILSCGIGSHLGQMIFDMHGKDARIELMDNGAAIEWANALGASYIPRNFGGYDETHNSLLLAGFMGRTRFRAADPITQRMHTTIDGLLSVSGIPPIEIARNFNALSISRFRTLVNKLMRQIPLDVDISEAVSALNSDVIAFEKRKARLKNWKIDTLIVGGIVKPIGDIIDAKTGYFASVIAAWLFEHLRNRAPLKLHNELSTTIDMMLGLVTASSLDTVIVSRSNKFIHHKDGSAE